jgi:hypothetical protein
MSMKITLTQHGGHMAAFNRSRPPQVVDSATLDNPKAAELQGLAAAAASAPARAASGKARDEMGYTITIEDQGRETVLSQSDTTMSEEFSKLLGWLRRHPAK